jgi:proline racemase
VINSRFEGRIAATTRLQDGTVAIAPTISGRAWISGVHTYVLDPEDPWPEGYTLSDTWYRALS